MCAVFGNDEHPKVIVLFKEEAEAVFLGGEIVDVTFQTPASEECHPCLIPAVKSACCPQANPI